MYHWTELAMVDYLHLLLPKIIQYNLKWMTSMWALLFQTMLIIINCMTVLVMFFPKLWHILTSIIKRYPQSLKMSAVCHQSTWHSLQGNMEPCIETLSSCPPKSYSIINLICFLSGLPFLLYFVLWIICCLTVQWQREGGRLASLTMAD